MPVAEPFFPGPQVGYARVSVKSIHNKSNKNLKSGVGTQVSEFYTARDFPVITDFTPFTRNLVKKTVVSVPLLQGQN